MGQVISMSGFVRRQILTAKNVGGSAVVARFDPTRDRILSALEKSPSLHPLHTACMATTPATTLRKEHVLASLLERMPCLPATTEADEISDLYSRPLEDIFALARTHIADVSLKGLHLTLLPAWDDLSGDERDFAQRCAVVLVSALAKDGWDGRARSERR